MNGVGLGHPTSFEDVLRVKIAATESKVGKGVLKVVLGEFQQKNSKGKATEADAYNIIETIISGNKETMGYMKPDDPRRAVLEEEIQAVFPLLPPYLSVDDVLTKIRGNEKLLVDVNDYLSKCDKSKF